LNGTGLEVAARRCDFFFPYFFAVESVGLEFNRFTTLVNAVPGGEAIAEEKDSDAARGESIDDEAITGEKDGDAPLGGFMGEETYSDEPLGETIDARARLRLRFSSTGERTGIAIINHGEESTRTCRIRKKRATTGCVQWLVVVADPTCMRHS
jgi:hypothetical protein